MKTVPKLKQLIEQIAQKHEMDLYRFGAYINLELNDDRLIIENVGASRVSIAYLFWFCDEWRADPEIVVWTNYHPTWLSEEEAPNQWVPIELYQIKDGWNACADIDTNGNMVGFYRREWQAWFAEFTENIVVSNLISQGWLEQGIKTDQPPPTYTLEQMRERGYLVEETYSSEEEEYDDCPF